MDPGRHWAAFRCFPLHSLDLKASTESDCLMSAERLCQRKGSTTGKDPEASWLLFNTGTHRSPIFWARGAYMYKYGLMRSDRYDGVSIFTILYIMRSTLESDLTWTGSQLREAKIGVIRSNVFFVKILAAVFWTIWRLLVLVRRKQNV